MFFAFEKMKEKRVNDSQKGLLFKNVFYALIWFLDKRVFLIIIFDITGDLYREGGFKF